MPLDHDEEACCFLLFSLCFVLHTPSSCSKLGFVDLMPDPPLVSILAGRKLVTKVCRFVPVAEVRRWQMHLPCQALMALVNVNRLPNGSAIDMSLVPQGICSIPGRAYL